MTKPSDDILGRDYDAALAQVTLADETVQQELSARANPVLAERQGVTKQLISAGLHEPTGSTVNTSDAFDGAATAKPSTKRFDPRDKYNADEQKFEGYVIVSGSYGQVKATLRDCAETRNVETIIGADNGKEIGLTATLTKHEIAHLARYGATCLTGNKQPITLNVPAAPAARA